MRLVDSCIEPIRVFSSTLYLNPSIPNPRASVSPTRPPPLPSLRSALICIHPARAQPALPPLHPRPKHQAPPPFSTNASFLTTGSSFQLSVLGRSPPPLDWAAFLAACAAAACCFGNISFLAGAGAGAGAAAAGALVSAGLVALASAEVLPAAAAAGAGVGDFLDGDEGAAREALPLDPFVAACDAKNGR